MKFKKYLENQGFIISKKYESNIYSLVFLLVNIKNQVLNVAKCIEYNIDQDSNDTTEEDEIKINKKLSINPHPNVIKMLSVVKLTSSRWIMFFEHAEYSLMDYWRQSPHDNKEVLIKQILQSVHYCNSLNILHFDIYQENFVVKNDIVKLIDFGSAIEYDYKLALNSEWDDNNKFLEFLPFRPCSRCPEIYINKKYNPIKAQIWAIGCCLINLILGQNYILYNIDPFIDNDEELSIKMSENYTTFFSLPSEPKELNSSNSCEYLKNNGSLFLQTHPLVVQLVNNNNNSLFNNNNSLFNNNILFILSNTLAFHPLNRLLFEEILFNEHLK